MGLNCITTKILLHLFIMTSLLLLVFTVSSQFSFAQSQNGQTYSIPSIYNSTGQKQFDSSEICNQRIPIIRLTSSASELGNPPGNAIDNNINTRSSSQSVNKYIQLDLGSIKTICGISIAWYKGDVRQSFFTISTSRNGVNYSNVFQGNSSGHSRQFENYKIQSTDGRYVKIIVSRNTQNTWASISEITIFGLNLSPNPPPSVNHPPIISNVTGISTPEGKAIAIPIIVSDPDQGDSAMITNKSAPAHGKLTLGPTQNSFVYTSTSGTQDKIVLLFKQQIIMERKAT